MEIDFTRFTRGRHVGWDVTVNGCHCGEVARAQRPIGQNPNNGQVIWEDGWEGRTWADAGELGNFQFPWFPTRRAAGQAVAEKWLDIQDRLRH